MNNQKLFFYTVPIFLLISGTLTKTFAQGNESGMVLVNGGNFTMGKDSESGANFSPAHTVTVGPFLMDIYEVTNASYFRFCEETGHPLPEFWGVEFYHCGPSFLNYPVVGVNWLDASAYATWAEKRLPTEAEWEYAARGGLTDREYPNGNRWTQPRRTNSKKEEWINKTVEVGSFEPNGFGLYDMGGNVWEWVSDRYLFNYYETSPENNPQGPVDGTHRIVRGGSWHSGPMCKKVYYRNGLPANWIDFGVGFRCAKDPVTE